MHFRLPAPIFTTRILDETGHRYLLSIAAKSDNHRRPDQQANRLPTANGVGH
jgi:hypothetical protein